MTYRSALIGKSTESGSGSANQTTTATAPVNAQLWSSEAANVDGQKQYSQEMHMS